MKRYCFVLILGLFFINSNAQRQHKNFEDFERTGKILLISDSSLIHLVTASVGDTVIVAAHNDTPVYGVVMANKAVNHAVSNLSIELIASSKTILVLSYRKGLPKGQGFIGRITQSGSKEVYLLSFQDNRGYYFEKVAKDKVIVN